MILKTKNIRILHVILVFIVIASAIPIIQSDSIQLLSDEPPEFILDQHQENDTYETSIHQHISLAQEFIPSL